MSIKVRLYLEKKKCRHKVTYRVTYMTWFHQACIPAHPISTDIFEGFVVRSLCKAEGFLYLTSFVPYLLVCQILGVPAGSQANVSIVQVHWNKQNLLLHSRDTEDQSGSKQFFWFPFFLSKEIMLQNFFYSKLS